MKSTPEARFKDRFKALELKSEDLRIQLTPLIERLDYYQENRKGNEFNALIINYASAYPQDQQAVISLFNDDAPKTKKFAKMVKNPYTENKFANEDKCDGCEDENITYGEYLKQQAKEQGEQPPTPQQLNDAGKELTDCKTTEEILKVFGDGEVEYVEVFNRMKAFADSIGLELGGARKKITIARKILDAIKA